MSSGRRPSQEGRSERTGLVSVRGGCGRTARPLGFSLSATRVHQRVLSAVVRGQLFKTSLSSVGSGLLRD